MAFPGDVNALGSVSGSQTLAAAGHATRHNEVKTALEGIRDALGGTAVPSGTVQPILAAGSASAPSLSFTGDSNTGLWSPAADTVAASTGGTERMRIDSAGLITGTGTSLGAWGSWTPVIGNTWVIGNGTVAGRYCQIGKIIHFTAKITMGSSTTFGSDPMTITLPVNANTAGHLLCDIRYSDVSAGAEKFGWGRYNSTSTIAPQYYTGDYVTTTSPFTWQTDDTLIVSGTYEIA